MAHSNRDLVALRDWATKKSTTDQDLDARPVWAQIAGDVDAYLDGPDPIPHGPSLFETTEATP